MAEQIQQPSCALGFCPQDSLEFRLHELPNAWIITQECQQSAKAGIGGPIVQFSGSTQCRRGIGDI